MSLLAEIVAAPPQPLAGRVVLVTGGAQGMGRGIAQAVLGVGATSPRF